MIYMTRNVLYNDKCVLGAEYERVWWWVFVGTRGGATRARIMRELLKRPLNRNQIAERLNLNYKTVEHHLKILVENHLVENPVGSRYGALYYPSRTALSLRDVLDRLLDEACGGGDG